MDLAVESARSAKMRVEETWGAQTAQLLQVVKDSTAIMGEQVRVAAATPRPLARVLVADAAATGRLMGLATGTPPQSNTDSSRQGGASPTGPSSGGEPISQALGDTLRQSGSIIKRGGGTPSNTFRPTLTPSNPSPFSVRRPDPSLSTTLPLGGDTASLYRSYTAALSRSERAGVAEVERVVAESDRLLSSHDAAGGAALREMERLNAMAGEEIGGLRTAVSALTSQLAAAVKNEKLAVAAALAAPLGITLGATVGVLSPMSSPSRVVSTSRRVAPTSSPSHPKRGSTSPLPQGVGAAPDVRVPDPVAGAPSPWPASYASAAVLASPIKWRPAKAGAFPSGPTPRGETLGGRPTRGIASSTVTEMLASINSGRSESLGVPVAVAISKRNTLLPQPQPQPQQQQQQQQQRQSPVPLLEAGGSLAELTVD